MVFIFTVMNAIMPEIMTVEVLRIYLIIAFIDSVIGALLYKKGLSPKELWIKRTVVYAACAFSAEAIIFFFPPEILDTRGMLPQFFWSAALSTVAFSLYSYFVLAKVERHYLDKINAKLSEK